jgi:hypothetical protein
MKGNSDNSSLKSDSQLSQNGDMWSTYNEVLSTVSETIKDTPEFNSCIQSNISKCIQSSTMELAQRNKDPEFCEALKSEDQKNSCQFAITMSLVQENWDSSLCETLSENYKKICISQSYRMKAMSEKDIKLCNKIPPTEIASGSSIRNDNSYEQGQCIMNVILSIPTSKTSDCNKIGDPLLENMCTTTINQRTPKTSESQVVITIPRVPKEKTATWKTGTSSWQ